MKIQGKKGRNRKNSLGIAVACILAGLSMMTGMTGCQDGKIPFLSEWGGGMEHQSGLPEYVDVQIIAVNGKARRGEKLEGVHDIVIHYVGNPGTTAQNNHDYFGNPQTEVSAHFLVGLEGEVIQCVPLDEKSSASNERNVDTISIEVCHPDETGAFTQASYDRVVQLTAWLCKTYGLDSSHVIRHYDITGKQCPLYYVEHEEAWNQLRADVQQILDAEA